MSQRRQKLTNLWEKTLKAKVEKKLSFSQYSNWLTCPHLHYLISVSKKMPYLDSDFTAYGYPLHETLEKMMLELELEVSSSPEDNYSFFLQKYKKNIEKILEEKTATEEELSYDNVLLFSAAAKSHIKNIIPFLKDKFGDFRIISVEEEFDSPIGLETEYYYFTFRGIMDLVIQTDDGMYHIIDWKTSKNGWSDYKKEDEKTTDQLLIYKLFYSRKHGIKFDNIESHFIILETNSKEIDCLHVEFSEEDIGRFEDNLKTMIYNAFEKRRYPKTALCGNFCDCKRYYLTNDS